MLILYPEKQDSLYFAGSNIPINVHKGSVYGISGGNLKIQDISQVEVTVQYIKEDGVSSEIIEGCNMYLFFDRLFNQNYVSSSITDGWVLYDDYEDIYYHIGTYMIINSRETKSDHDRVRFNKVELTQSGVNLYFDGKKSYILRSPYASYKTPIEDMRTGIPFFNDFHVARDKMPVC